MRRVVLLTILALALPIAAFCDSNVDFNSSHGTLTGSLAGLQLTGSTLIGVTGLYGNPTGNLGMVSFTTGALLTGDLSAGATFSGAGSTFTVMGNGTGGVPNTTLFTGSFAGNVTLTESGTSLHNYFFSGVVSGTTLRYGVELCPYGKNQDPFGAVAASLRCHCSNISSAHRRSSGPG